MNTVLIDGCIHDNTDVKRCGLNISYMKLPTIIWNIKGPILSQYSDNKGETNGARVLCSMVAIVVGEVGGR